MSINKSLYSIDLFSGAGGLSLGMHQSDINCIAAIEIDRFAAETYRSNFSNTSLYERSVTGFTSKEIKSLFSGVDIIAASPPCQGFSVAGPSQYGKIDKKNKLLLEVVRFTKIIKPKIVILENVKGLLSGKVSKTNKALKIYSEAMREIGFKTSHIVLQAAKFGVPQWRERVFVFSVIDDKNILDLMTKLNRIEKPKVNVGEAIYDLPEIHSGEGADELMPYCKKADNKYQKLMRKYSKGVLNHTAMKHTPRLLERFKHIPIGGSLLDVPSEVGQRMRNGTEIDVRSRFKMNNQRLDPNKISLAITASFQSNFVHPLFNRNLTAREGGRIQSFPDTFIFKGPRTLMSKSLLKKEERYDEIGVSQYNQIGNAVPPKMAEEIMKVIKIFIEKHL